MFGEIVGNTNITIQGTTKKPTSKQANTLTKVESNFYDSGLANGVGLFYPSPTRVNYLLCWWKK